MGEQPRPRKPGPRGRGLGKPTATVFRCAVCGAKQSAAEIDHQSQCQQCKTELHTCTHCRYFDSSALNECRQPVSARVGSKAKANSCDLYEPKATQEFAAEAPSAKATSASAAKAAFDALFKS